MVLGEYVREKQRAEANNDARLASERISSSEAFVRERKKG